MDSTSQYRTIAHPASAELKIEKSLFIGHVAEAQGAESVKEFIAAIRAEHHEATHNCYAYRFGQPPADTTYFNDHGEPAGTAGKPILGTILRRDLTDVVVVVTRYFGGKKLGVRGLIEAYGEASGLVLDAAGVCERVRLTTVRLTCTYAQLAQMQHLIREVGGAVNTTFAADVQIEVTLPLDAKEPLLERLSTAGLLPY